MQQKLHPANIRCRELLAYSESGPPQKFMHKRGTAMLPPCLAKPDVTVTESLDKQHVGECIKGNPDAATSHPNSTPSF
jgi:hypothetical protein